MKKQIVLYGTVVEYLNHKRKKRVYPATRVKLDHDSYVHAIRLIERRNRSKRALSMHPNEEVLVVFEDQELRTAIGPINKVMYFKFEFVRAFELKAFFDVPNLLWYACRIKETN